MVYIYPPALDQLLLEAPTTSDRRCMFDYLQYVRLQFPEVDVSLEDLGRRLIVVRTRHLRLNHAKGDQTTKRIRSCKAYNFTPEDDRRLLATGSVDEYRTVVSNIASENNIPKDSIRRRAKKLNVRYVEEQEREAWRETRKNKIKSILATSKSTAPAYVEAVKLGIDPEAVRNLIKRDATVAGVHYDNYTQNEVSTGLCMTNKTLRGHIQSGALKVYRLSNNGKLYISGDAVYDFIEANPRAINWDKVFENSCWLQDVLIDQRKKQICQLFQKEQKTVTTWVNKGLLRIVLSAKTPYEIVSDVPVYEFLVTNEHLVDVDKCAQASPEWFRKYLEWKEAEKDRSRQRNKRSQRDGSSRGICFTANAVSV